MTINSLRDVLDECVNKFNRPEFIEPDPISVPHKYSKKQDIEIAGLMAAVFAWGNRQTIIRKTIEFLSLMDNAPHDFLMNHSERDLKVFEQFVHRTFQPTDALYFIDFLSRHYKSNDSLEDLFLPSAEIEQGLRNFHNQFFAAEYAPSRTKKHIATPERNSSCKRLTMFLRWMVRHDNAGVDFGIWNKMNQANLICPIDLHVSRISRELGLLKRKQNDWQAAVELTNELKKLDSNDPVKYDFALFGLGVVGGVELVIDRLS